MLADAGDTVVRVRPHHDVWSMLEYACHVRDVLLVQRERAVLALVEANPGFARMYRDERVAWPDMTPTRPARSSTQLAWQPNCAPPSSTA